LFQAEDGIRDATVTGVQTCTLPIFYPLRNSTTSAATKTVRASLLPQRFRAGPPPVLLRRRSPASPSQFGLRPLEAAGRLGAFSKIGRASCRERRSMRVGEDGGIGVE